MHSTNIQFRSYTGEPFLSVTKVSIEYKASKLKKIMFIVPKSIPREDMDLPSKN